MLGDLCREEPFVFLCAGHSSCLTFSLCRVGGAGTEQPRPCACFAGCGQGALRGRLCPLQGPASESQGHQEKLTLGDAESQQISVCLSSGHRTVQSRCRQGVCPAGCPGSPEDAGQHRLDAASFFRVECYAFNYLKGRERESKLPHPLVHSPDACDSQGWTSLRAAATDESWLKAWPRQQGQR